MQESLVSRDTHPEDTRITIGNHVIGRDFTWIAGPCSVEAADITFRLAEQVANLEIPFFRAGAYKPRTSPYSFQGLGSEGVEILNQVKQQFGLAVVTEVIDAALLDEISAVADILQIGARNMGNTRLLKAVGQSKTPVLLKRGMSATLEEYLQAAEYILVAGNPNVILCERGIRTFDTHCRFTLDIAAVPNLRRLSHLPVLVDPSHAAGTQTLVAPLAKAAVAAGAQGLMIEIHDDPKNAYSDGLQAIHPDELAELMKVCDTLQGVST
ncbi:MAG: hypothetical protein DHS20C10_07980 [marine bacterium B5-7]|nr:MAG: hypothetical protein DHS20C10_07980 [marine bacterium B5-7]